MAEYIDREEMLKYIDEHTNQDEWLVNQYNADWIYDFIDSRPTADVVPKSEVIAIFDELESTIDLIGAMVGLDIRLYGSYAELKKKYTENLNG